jgi:peptidoglycan/LPS O-acetylase OafA/YrhL
MAAAPIPPRADAARLHPLDGLRGAAAIVVVAFHVLVHTAQSDRFGQLLLASPIGLLVNGPGAVHVFFVLSGYVLALTLARDVSAGRIPRFYVRRVFRIHPPYVAAVLLAWVVSQSVVPRGLPDPPWARIPAEALPVALAFPSMAFGLLPVGWSLFVELAQSAIFPLLFALSRRFGAAAALLAAALLLQPIDPRLRFLRFTFDFALGLALCTWSEPIARGLARLPRATAAALGVAGAALLQLPYALGLAESRIVDLAQGHAPAVVAQFALGSALLLVAALHAPGLRRVLSTPVALSFGRISYSLYLVHYTVLMPFVLRAPEFSLSWPLALAVFAATLALSTALAHAGWGVVEAPAIRAGRAVIRGGEVLARRVSRLA